MLRLLKAIQGAAEAYPHATALLRSRLPSMGWAERGALAQCIDDFGDHYWRTVDAALFDIQALFSKYTGEASDGPAEIMGALGQLLADLPHNAHFDSFDDVVEQFYDRPVYPLLEHSMYLHPVGIERARQVLNLVEGVEFGAAGELADLGVGPAVLFTRMLEHLPGWRGQAFDVSEHCVGYAADVLELHNIDSARFAVAQADARALPVAEGAFDLVVATEIIEHVPDPSALLIEIRRVLKPGGRLIASVPIDLPWGPHLAVFESVAEVRALFSECFDIEELNVATLDGVSELAFARLSRA